ncbi:MAG: RNA polymerase sigma factor [Deltaproteobacteria bacterium]|nr:RNA polymerase sigma factor [Deltaproteobacteria bacterium]
MPAAASLAPLPAADLVAQIEALHPASFGWALACCRRDRESAADVLQQAYCRILSGQARFDGRSALRTWLFGVIRLTALEHRRWSWLPYRLAMALRLTAPSPERGAAPDEAVEAHEKTAHLSRALAELAARQREVLHLVFYEELTIQEASRVMGVSLGAARQHYERGKRNLSARLAEKEGRR